MNSFLGIDTHKDSVTVAAVDAVGREVTSVTAVNDGRGFRKVEGFARRVGAVRVGIEASGSYGLGLAHRLLAAGFDVREVPAQLTRRERRSVARGKSDAIDALPIARVTARQDDLPPPPVEGLAHDLKALVDHRDTLLRDATRHRNRAHALLVQICPGYQTIVPKLDSRPKTRAARRFIADNASVRAGLVRDALDRVDELEAAAAKQIHRYCEYRGFTLARIYADIDHSGYNNSRARLALNELCDQRRQYAAVVSAQTFEVWSIDGTPVRDVHVVLR